MVTILSGLPCSQRYIREFTFRKINFTHSQFILVIVLKFIEKMLTVFQKTHLFLVYMPVIWAPHIDCACFDSKQNLFRLFHKKLFQENVFLHQVKHFNLCCFWGHMCALKQRIIIFIHLRRSSPSKSGLMVDVL